MLQIRANIIISYPSIKKHDDLSNTWFNLLSNQCAIYKMHEKYKKSHTHCVNIYFITSNIFRPISSQYEMEIYLINVGIYSVRFININEWSVLCLRYCSMSCFRRYICAPKF